MSGWGHQQRSDNVLAWSGCDLVGSSELASGSLACDKRAAKRAYDGNRGYQPVLALWFLIRVKTPFPIRSAATASQRAPLRGPRRSQDSQRLRSEARRPTR